MRDLTRFLHSNQLSSQEKNYLLQRSNLNALSCNPWPMVFKRTKYTRLLLIRCFGVTSWIVFI